MEYLGQFAIVHLILHVICICISYWALNAVRLEQFFKKGFPFPCIHKRTLARDVLSVRFSLPGSRHCYRKTGKLALTR